MVDNVEGDSNHVCIDNHIETLEATLERFLVEQRMQLQWFQPTLARLTLNNGNKRSEAARRCDGGLAWGVPDARPNRRKATRLHLNSDDDSYKSTSFKLESDRHMSSQVDRNKYHAKAIIFLFDDHFFYWRDSWLASWGRSLFQLDEYTVQ